MMAVIAAHHAVHEEHDRVLLIDVVVKDPSPDRARDARAVLCRWSSMDASLAPPASTVSTIRPELGID